MDKKEYTFSGQTFLNKEAAVPKALLRALPFMRKSPKAAAKGASSRGTFFRSPGDGAVDPSKVRMFNSAEVADKVNDAGRASTGSLAGDGLLGITKKVVPRSKETIESGVRKARNSLENFDTKLGSRLAGNNPDSFRGKLFSTKTIRQVGEAGDTPLSIQGRRASALAPVSNTSAAAAPILGSMYLAEKFYPMDEESEGDTVNHATHEKEASAETNEDVFDSAVVSQMEKSASMQKIAALEDQLTKYASKLESAEMEKQAAERKLEETVREKREIEKKASYFEENLMEKTAEYEELRLRTIAQKRSKVAVDLSDELLESGIIKQAQLKSTIDKLMNSDEETINMYKSMIKEAKQASDCLESLSLIGEYSSNDKLAFSSKEYAPNHLSKKGQSLGEAARDLNSKL